MENNYFFEAIKGEIDKKKEAKKTVPLTIDENEAEGLKPMNLKDHWLSLRQSIQNKLVVEEPTAEEAENIKLLNELISPELLADYGQLMKLFSQKVKKSPDHPDREFVDTNSPEFSGPVDAWIEKLLAEIKVKNNELVEGEGLEELKAQCQMYFEAMGNVLNTKSLDGDIQDFYKGKITDEEEEGGPERQKAELVEELSNRYPIDKAGIGILVDIIQAEKDGKGEYSLRILTETIARLWDEYDLNKKKGEITKISLGYLMSKGANSFSPSLFQHILENDHFHMEVFLEVFCLTKLSGYINTKVQIELAKVMNEIDHQINERITNSLFFQEFEFMQETSLGEIYATLERGKTASREIIRAVIARFTPTLVGTAMSIGFLAKINPLLGAINLISLPTMAYISRKQNKQIAPMYEKEKRQAEKISTRLSTMKDGFEEIKTSPETPIIATHVKEQMNVRDSLYLKRNITEKIMDIKRMLPFDIASVVAAVVGGIFQQRGIISGGAVLSNIIYSERLTGPIQDMVDLYYNTFARYIQDIQRMEEIFGAYDKLDLPEGEKEKDRLPVSDLKNFDISVKNLSFKNILNDVNLDIKQGEYVSIVGASGAGKSTLLRNLVGLYKPDGGTIEIGGIATNDVKKYGAESLYSVMSYCNSKPQKFEGMTLRENLLLWSKKEVADDRIKQILGDLHLDKFTDRLDEEIKHFSSGEIVRVGVARTLIKGAKIMLLDEPTSNLDSQSATEVREIISEINKKYPDTTIICVSHDQDLARSSNRSINIADLQKKVS